MSDNPSIMPLVEENRALHAQLQFLKAQLDEQNVRLDKFLEGNPDLKRVLHPITVTVSGFEMAEHGPRAIMPLVWSRVVTELERDESRWVRRINRAASHETTLTLFVAAIGEGR